MTNPAPIPSHTFCDACDNVVEHTRSFAPWRWQCIKHPRSEGFGFVTQTAWDDMPPHLYCKDVNGGQCPLFEKKREEG